MKTMTWQRVLLTLCFAIGPQLLWAGTEPNKEIHVDRDLGGDRFVAGCPISVTRPVTGDLMGAGCDVDVSAEVDGDVIVMGGNLRLTAPVKQNLYAAGGHVSIGAPVARNLRVAGGRVTLGPDAKVAGNVTVAGGEVDLEGAIGGYLQVAGGRVHINGPIAGDVEAGAGEVELGPNARIEGKLTYTSGDEIVQDPAAQVRGGVTRLERGERWPASHHWHIGERHHSVWHGWKWSLGLLVFAALFVAALPQFYHGLAEKARTRWALSMLIGFVVLVCTPIAALICMITIIGIPLGLLLVAIYLGLLLVGYVSAGIALGNVVLQKWWAEHAAKTGWRIGAAVLAMAAISLLGRVPFVGWLVTLAAMLTGIGLVLMQLRPAPAAPATPAPAAPAT